MNPVFDRLFKMYWSKLNAKDKITLSRSCTDCTHEWQYTGAPAVEKRKFYCVLCGAEIGFRCKYNETFSYALSGEEAAIKDIIM